MITVKELNTPLNSLPNIGKSDWRKYEEFVLTARTMLIGKFELKMDLAKIAIEACKLNSVTMKAFAKDIGMKPTTLGEWVSLYKNVHVKMPKGKDKSHLRNMQSYKNIRKTLSQTNIDPKRVFNGYIKHNAHYEKWTKYLSKLNTFMESARKDDIPEDLIEEIKHVASELKYYASKKGERK